MATKNEIGKLPSQLEDLRRGIERADLKNGAARTFKNAIRRRFAKPEIKESHVGHPKKN